MTTSELKGGPTQPEICAVAVDKLGVQKSDIAVDIGCGTGTVSIALAERAEHVYAIDIREEAIRVAQNAILTGGCSNITLVLGNATEFLEDLDEDEIIDVAFIGGTQDLETVLLALVERRVRSIVVNAVLLETAVLAISTMKRLGIFSEAVHLQVSRAHDLNGKTIFKPINPIYIITGRCR
ncbi:MAG: methyltransferase domain-containing protein [Methanocalculus sp. MSAO_Arc1]|uniref:bifunctional cobalt-precorrin-7 (C(5))-methyltransferase/cobalt-precorrin-6B (C(15))-methyltransferase n=1 Tax=Methanocalculus TaxID=71151 RepID=UPI000FF7F750|nr:MULTISPECIES: methyltransferase domain-containing protein [unclassified Methanocalculus]MCP1662395.1 cobalt-precorrin-6B (C15)-methyltransferase [Methanocalculus sp. AMF5]RQD81361.1 MAG: methyltransferase domain-containing protein [Methanocalculus sp. MSAO_Arc1]